MMCGPVVQDSGCQSSWGPRATSFVAFFTTSLTVVYQRTIPEQTSGGAEVSLLPGRDRPFLEPCCLFWPQPSLSLSSHLLSMTRKATTPRHMMFLPPTSLGLTPGSLSQVVASVSCPVSHTSHLTCSASTCVPGARAQCF